MQVSGVGSKPDELCSIWEWFTPMVMTGGWLWTVYEFMTLFYHVLPTLLLSPPKKTTNLFEMFAPKKWSCNYFFVDEAFWCILKIARSAVMAFGKFEEYALGSIEKYRKFKDFPSKAWRKWQSEFLLIAKWYHVFQIPARSAETCWNVLKLSAETCVSSLKIRSFRKIWLPQTSQTIAIHGFSQPEGYLRGQHLWLWSAPPWMCRP